MLRQIQRLLTFHKENETEQKIYFPVSSLHKDNTMYTNFMMLEKRKEEKKEEFESVCNILTVFTDNKYTDMTAVDKLLMII